MQTSDRMNQLRTNKFFALLRKEIVQIFRDKQLMSFLLIPPIVQILAYGYALSPQVEHLRLGIVNECPTPTSRELVTALVQNRVFDLQRVGGNERRLTKALAAGDLDAAVIIPPNFQRRLFAGLSAPVQILLDAVDANTAGIANGYLVQMINAFNSRLLPGATSSRTLPAPQLPAGNEQQPSSSNPNQNSGTGRQAEPTSAATGLSNPAPMNSLNVLRATPSVQPLPPTTAVVALFPNSASQPGIVNASNSLINSVVSGRQASGANSLASAREGNVNGFTTVFFNSQDSVNSDALSFNAPVRGSVVDNSQTASLLTQRPRASNPNGFNSAVSFNAPTSANTNNLILNSINNTDVTSHPLLSTTGSIITSSAALPGTLSALGTTAQNGLMALQMRNSPQIEISEALFPLGSIDFSQLQTQVPNVGDPSLTATLTQNIVGPPLAITAPPAAPLPSISGPNSARQRPNQQPNNNTPTQSEIPGARSPNLALTSFFNRNPIEPQISYLYNKGLTASWFFVPGVIGLVVTLTGTLVSTIAVVREKDSGTLEQLLMTPVGSLEILLSKIIPLFVLLIGDFLFALALGQGVFGVPLRGSLLLLMGITSLYIFVALSIGIVLATICENQRQAILTSFFFNLPLIQLSGAIAPVESMPDFCQYLALLNPLRWYIVCLRGILLKGVGLDVLWTNVLVLFVFAFVFTFGSVYKFRRQLG